jgi:hypothetical protein
MRRLEVYARKYICYIIIKEGGRRRREGEEELACVCEIEKKTEGTLKMMTSATYSLGAHV